MNNKKTIIASIIGVALLVLTVIGATFAYFTTAVTNDDGETLVTGKTDAIGSVALTNPTSNLHITLSALDMAQDNLNTYWATNDSTLNYDTEEAQRDIAVATLTGGEATTYYECSTTINVSVSGTMVAGLQSGDAYIQFGGLLTDKVDLTNVSSTGYPVTFELNGTDKLSDKVSASIAIENRNANQNSIAGKELSVTFSNNDLECNVVEAPQPEAFAIYSEDDSSLKFYKNNDIVNIGDTYKGLTVTNVYTGFENSTEVPWFDDDTNFSILTVEFVDKISPISTSDWFSTTINIQTIDLTNLDTSKVTNMSFMFIDSSPKECIGFDTLDVSNVTNMKSMFENFNNGSSTAVDGWDISGWNVSNVTDMQQMFSGVVYIPDISDWNTSNVTNMSNMFNYSITGYTAAAPLDLSEWDVSKVTSYSNFINGIDPSGSITPPNFN